MGAQRAMSAKQRRFADEYLVDLNACRAAIRAGYSPSYARGHAYRLIKSGQVAAYLAERQEEARKRLELTQDRVLCELAAVAFANATDFAEIADGQLRVKSSDEIAPEKAAAITAVEQGVKGVKLKLGDKLRALELLGRHLGVFEEVTEEEAGQPVVILDDLPAGAGQGAEGQGQQPEDDSAGGSQDAQP